MRRLARRMSTSLVLVAALAAVAAPSALADTATTGPATGITVDSAVLHGVVNDGDRAGVWQFQYGLTRYYGRATPLESVPASNENIPVSARIEHLKPNTTYHYRLVLVTGRGTIYLPLRTTYGADRQFTTRPAGALVLRDHNVFVHPPFLYVIFTCRSGLRCKGTFSITTRARIAHTHRFATILCTKPGTASYDIAPHRTRRVRARIERGCLSLLRRAHHHRIIAKLTSRPRTGQRGIITRVRLILI